MSEENKATQEETQASNVVIIDFDTCRVLIPDHAAEHEILVSLDGYFIVKSGIFFVEDKETDEWSIETGTTELSFDDEAALDAYYENTPREQMIEIEAKDVFPACESMSKFKKEEFSNYLIPYTIKHNGKYNHKRINRNKDLTTSYRINLRNVYDLVNQSVYNRYEELDNAQKAAKQAKQDRDTRLEEQRLERQKLAEEMEAELAQIKLDERAAKEEERRLKREAKAAKKRKDDDARMLAKTDLTQQFFRNIGL